MSQKPQTPSGFPTTGLFNQMSGFYAHAARQMLDMHLKNLETTRTLLDTWFERRHAAAEALCTKLDAVNGETDPQKRTAAIQEMGRDWFEGMSQEINAQIETMSRSAADLMENGGIKVPLETGAPAKAAPAQTKTRPSAS